MVNSDKLEIGARELCRQIRKGDIFDARYVRSPIRVALLVDFLAVAFAFGMITCPPVFFS